MKVTIYHNPRCSKSRKTLDLIRQHGVDPVIVRYLETPPDTAELKRLIEALGITAADLLRTGEPEYRELGLDGGAVTDERRIEAMATCPRLIERPIVICGDDARLGRPPERVLEILPR